MSVMPFSLEGPNFLKCPYLNEVNLDACMVNSVLWSPVEVIKVGMNKSRKPGGRCPEIVLVLVLPLSDLSRTGFVL